MKKAILVLVALIVVLGLVGSVVACGRRDNTYNQPTTTTKPTTTTPTTTKPPTTTATTTPTTKPTTATTVATTTTTAGAAPAIPHDLAGKDDCLLCHKTGIAGAKAVPTNHASYANAMCQLCHKPK